VHAETIEDLQEKWPGWKIWRTETMWNATRRGPLPRAPQGSPSRYGDLALTLLEDGPDELRTALQKQAEIEEEAAAVLALGHRDEHTLTASCPSYEKPAT